jgi:hypothetical protein
MRKTLHVLQTHAFDFWLACEAIALTALLNAVLINKTTFVPWWLASAFEIALLVPLSIATARAQVRSATLPASTIGS